MRAVRMGSSGEGTAKFGHTIIHKLLLPNEASLTTAAYVALDQGKGMDGVDIHVDGAVLYMWSTIDSDAMEDYARDCPELTRTRVRWNQLQLLGFPQNLTRDPTQSKRVAKMPRASGL